MNPAATENGVGRTLVIGLGNEFRNDDGIGVFIARRLHKLNLSHLESKVHSGEGSGLSELWKGMHNVIVVDASESGAKPGTIYRFDATDRRIPSEYFHCSTHNFGLAEAVEVSRALDTLPERLIVYGIEGMNYSPGSDLSPVTRKSAEYAIDIIIEEAARLSYSKISAGRN